MLMLNELGPFVATSPVLAPSEWGNAQDLTLGIFYGATILFAMLIPLWMRSGHERAHRTNVLRSTHLEQATRWRRAEELERLEPPPKSGEQGLK